MFGFIGLIVLIMILTIGLSAILFGTNIIDIMSNWTTRRCEPFVMFTAPLYKPGYDKRSTTEFAIDNFTFCLQTLSSDVMSGAFSPLFNMLKENFKVIDVASGLFKNFRFYFKTLIDKFTSIFESRYQQFRNLFDMFNHGFTKLESAFARINGMIIAIIFQAMSGYTFIQNLIQFIIKIIIIIIIILAALVFFLFFFMFPVIPMILTTIGIITAAGLGAAVGGYTGAFCLHPNTSIMLSNGISVPIKNINIGDTLLPSFKTYIFANNVTGILEADGSKTNLYDIDGIKISGTHRVFEKGEWVLVRNIERAKKINEKSNLLYILNTKHHWVSAKGNTDIVYVSDWEEVDNEHGQLTWLEFVAKKIGCTVPFYLPSSIPLVSKSVEVYKKIEGKPMKTNISDIKIGDKVFDALGKFTVVKAVYKGSFNTDLDTWISDGNWVFDKEWTLNSEGAKEVIKAPQQIGYQLITESGSFIVLYKNKEILLRDFTECGIENLEDCYDVLDKVL